ncbi:MAG: hypothetical protein ACREA0_26230 [bacterium]
MPKSGSLGSVRRALSNERPYRDRDNTIGALPIPSTTTRQTWVGQVADRVALLIRSRSIRRVCRHPIGRRLRAKGFGE